MRFVVMLLLVSFVARAADSPERLRNSPERLRNSPERLRNSPFEQLRQSYEKFFTARYSLEQDFPFRLISVRDRLVAITPTTDVLKPLVALSAADFGRDEAMTALLTKSFLPLLYGVTTDSRDLLTLSHQLLTAAWQQLSTMPPQLLHKLPADRISYTLFLAPYRKTDADLYYGTQKINMVRNGTVSLLSPDRNDAQHNITRAIDNYRALLFYNYDKTTSLPTPLAARLNFVMDNSKTTLRIDLLLHLYPQTMPYSKEEPPVSLRNFVVPEGAKFRFPTALLSVQTQLGNTPEPQLRVIFGNFVELKDMQFILAPQQEHSPYLEGSLQKFSPLQLKFRFQQLDIALQTMQAEKVRTTFSAGFQLGALRTADFGNFKVSKIDKKFKTAINEEIDGAKDKIISETLASNKVAKFIGNNTVKVLQQLFRSEHNTAKENTP